MANARRCLNKSAKDKTAPGLSPKAFLAVRAREACAEALPAVASTAAQQVRPYAVGLHSHLHPSHDHPLRFLRHLRHLLGTFPKESRTFS